MRVQQVAAAPETFLAHNGRLGLFGFVSEATVPGSVPALTGLIQPYSGDVMQPFANNVFTNPSWF